MPGRHPKARRASMLALILVTLLAGLLVPEARAALLGLIPDYPRISFDSQGVTVYEETSDLLSVRARGLSLRLSLADPPVPISESDLALDIFVDATGTFTGGVVGNDLVVTGEVLIDGNSVSGVLLTGEVLDFGWLDTGTTTDQYDFRVLVTGGELEGLYASMDAAVVMTSEQSSFTGDFTVDFDGNAKGTIGSTAPLDGSCGDGIVDPLREECDPPGLQEQCLEGELCSSVCRCGAVPPDHFKCYRARRTQRPGFQARDVTLEDQFGATTATVLKSGSFCNPADKNDEGIVDPTRHLSCYKLKCPSATKRILLVTDQFGEHIIETRKAKTLCLPAEKNGVPMNLDLDHYQCYSVKPPKFETQVTIEDQFEDKTFIVKKPYLFCNPVIKNQEAPLIHPEDHLLCYRIYYPKGVPKMEKTLIQSLDQFEDQELLVEKIETLCVPASKHEILP